MTRLPQPLQLTITRTFAVAELGTIAFFDCDDEVPAPGSVHRVCVARPDGSTTEAVASVEHVKNEVLGEFPALLFATLSLADVTEGCRVSIVGGAP